jgi:hypothetical protein
MQESDALEDAGSVEGKTRITGRDQQIEKSDHVGTHLLLAGSSSAGRPGLVQREHSSGRSEQFLSLVPP